MLRKENEIYINDGIYGSLSEMVAVNMQLPVRLLRLDGNASRETTQFTVYGPTCDSLDVLPCAFALPSDVREDDWLEIGQVGAYSNAVATRFNRSWRWKRDSVRPTSVERCHFQPTANLVYL